MERCLTKATLPPPVLRMVLCSAAKANPQSVGRVLAAAFQKAVKSGSAGFAAGTLQVLAFMWLRTAMNYQYKNGGTMAETLSKLYEEGGIARLYKGLFPWAIFQAPLSRFGDVAANDMVLGVMGKLLPQVPVGAATFLGSMAGAAWRIVITPVDTVKTILQTDGQTGYNKLKAKISDGGVLVLWSGWEGNYVANVVGNYPWFATMNVLQKNVPIPDGPFKKLLRNAVLGAMSSTVSDLVSNSIRVVKTKKQTHSDVQYTYVNAAKDILEKDGVNGLLFRGLETRIFTNILQTAFFTVLWKSLQGL
eukprot:TRINITY_DN120948_c0_g1_i1.p1 TRINITY_DN120948_c0_g1~~TRINITY_DN120948_c0_g1_i1.p1  ORF type:complete len:305 (+),score=92.22 TRINITY_DN120948_c0_g1_i1:77-991(+)